MLMSKMALEKKHLHGLVDMGRLHRPSHLLDMI